MKILKESITSQSSFKGRVEAVLKNLTYQEMLRYMNFRIPSRLIKYNFSDDGVSGDYEFEAEYNESVDKQIWYKVSEDFASYVNERLSDEQAYQEAYNWASEDYKEEESNFIWKFLGYFANDYLDSNTFDDYCDDTLKEYFKDASRADWREQESDHKANQQMHRDSYYW